MRMVFDCIRSIVARFLLWLLTCYLRWLAQGPGSLFPVVLPIPALTTKPSWNSFQLVKSRPLHHLSLRLEIAEICQPLLDLGVLLLSVVKVVSVAQVIGETCKSRG
jgi:hypothetical protein